MASRMGPLLAEPPPGHRYNPANDMYGPGDAAIFRAMPAPAPATATSSGRAGAAGSGERRPPH